MSPSLRSQRRTFRFVLVLAISSRSANCARPELQISTRTADAGYGDSVRGWDDRPKSTSVDAGYGDSVRDRDDRLALTVAENGQRLDRLERLELAKQQPAPNALSAQEIQE